MKSKLSLFLFLVTIVLICVFGILAMPGCTAAGVAAADKAIGGTPLQATQVPTSQPGVFMTVQPTTQQVTLHFVQDAAGDAAPIVAAAAPQPWGTIAGLALTLIASGIAAYQTIGKQSAQSTIANAAPAIVAAMTPQFIAAVPALTALVCHPSAANAIAALSAANGASNQSYGSRT